MVLQRDVPSTVWGFAPAGTTVKTTFAGNTYTTSSGADTIWRQQLPATPATAAGQTISFSTSAGDKAALNDVVFGDVYICSGQSS
jgi:sialate O-acetylesterase